MAKTFVLHDESINSYGFWLRTAGADLAQFIKNPIMLWNHNRPWREEENQVLPIGHWENIRIEGDKILAEPVFDDDAFSQKIAKKVENGTLRMASIGVKPIEVSSDPVWIKPGQRYETVLKFRVREASIVDIGSNDNALAMYDDDDKLIELSASSGEGIPLKELVINKNKQEMKELAKLLKLAEGATEAEVVEAIKPIQSENVQLKADLEKEQNEKKALSDKLDAIELAEKAAKRKSFDDELRLAFKDGRLTEKEDKSISKAWENLYDKDPEGTLVMLSSLPKRKPVANSIGGNGGTEGKKSPWELRQEEIEAANKKK
jgi:hypothetical protein